MKWRHGNIFAENRVYNRIFDFVSPILSKPEMMHGKTNMPQGQGAAINRQPFLSQLFFEQKF